jgi:hypothetical protein
MNDFEKCAIKRAIVGIIVVLLIILAIYYFVNKKLQNHINEIYDYEYIVIDSEWYNTGDIEDIHLMDSGKNFYVMTMEYGDKVYFSSYALKDLKNQ